MIRAGEKNDEEPGLELILGQPPRPVYWTTVRGEGQPLVEDDPRYGKVYHTGSAADVFELM